MAYRVIPGDRARARLGGFPPHAFDALIQTLTDVADSPYDPLRTYPTKDPQIRWVIFGGWGFAEYHIDDAAELVTLTDLTWTG